MNVIFDLDGTLANCDHRVAHISGEIKDWRAFYASCHKDVPIAPILRMAHALRDAGHRLQIWTGRSAEVGAQTQQWLVEHDLGAIPLRMRPIGDDRPDVELKAWWLDACGFMPDLVVEDRASVVQMWRDRGIICVQVAPGDF